VKPFRDLAIVAGKQELLAGLAATAGHAPNLLYNLGSAAVTATQHMSVKVWLVYFWPHLQERCVDDDDHDSQADCCAVDGHRVAEDAVCEY
jgi:hypothetical protein